MYSPKVIQRNTHGLDLRYHSLAEVERAIAHFNSIARFDDDGDWTGEYTRPLDKDELAFQRNEALLCKWDFNYASSRYARIMDWTKRLVPFTPNLAQRIKLDIYSELEERGVALVIQALKARQLGSSTLDELIVWHRVTFRPHTEAIVGSSDPEKSAKMFGMVERAWKHTPFWLKPECTKYSRGEFYEFGNVDSSVSIQHGTQFSGIGRGTTPSVAHLSEIVDYDEPEQLIDASLLRALHEHPEAYISLESTANGRGDWWHKTWVANKENVANGMAKMYPVFLPWFVGRDIYPTETWLRARPVPPAWEPQDSTIQHAVRAADYVSRTPLLKRYLGESWTMPVEQMWWYEVERKWALQKNELNIFLSECPASDDEAFQSRTGSIFPIEIISDRREATTLPKWALSIDGDDIPQRLVVPATQLQSVAPLKLDYGHEPSKMTRLRGSFCVVDQNFDPTNKLCLWEMPQEGEEYEISVDTGYGIGEDRSVIQVGRRGTPERSDAQVGEWASAEAGALDLWPILLGVGRLFTGVSHDGRILEPRITIELAANGEALQAELRKRGWRNFYVRNRLATAVRSESIINPQLGWVTSHQSRQRLIDHLIKVVRDNLVEIRSPWLVDELADLQRSEKNFKIEAARGAHDDRLMSFAIMSYVMYDLDLRGEPSSMYRQRREAAAAAARAPEYSPGAQALPGWAPGMEDLLQ